MSPFQSRPGRVSVESKASVRYVNSFSSLVGMVKVKTLGLGHNKVQQMPPLNSRQGVFSDCGLGTNQTPSL